jgi:thiosulfate/3-mercaptopyruvate sulfurtransferase
MTLPIAAALALSLQGPGDTMLVTVEWLTQHLRDPKLVLLQVGPRAGFDSVHIPGARWIGLEEVSAPSTPGAPILELPDPAALDSVLEAKGISDDSRIVIYEAEGWFSPSTRVYLTLYWAGLGARTSLLDGGLAGWRSRGGEVTSGPSPAARRGSLTLRPRDDVVVTADWLAARLTAPRVRVLDARAPRFFLGNYTSEREPRVGRIPGSYNVPFSSMVADSLDHVRGPDRLRELFRSAAAAPGDTVVTYCHIGQQASAVWFGAKLAGYHVRLYDGSFTQWSTLTQYPVERP